MGLQVNSNIPGLFAQRQLGQASGRAARRLEQLAAGLRITRASIDAAGLAIAERFETSVRQLNQEISSFQSGVNLTQTADAALGTQGDAVQRLRELAVQAGNGTLNDEQRQAINEEAQQLLQEIDATAQNTEFNGTTVLNGDANNIQLDPEGEVQVNVNESTVDSLGLTGLDLSTAGGAQAAINALDTAQIRINQNRANVGAQENRIVRAIDERANRAVNEQDAQSRIRDLDVARAVIEQTRNQNLIQGGIAALAQSNLNNRNALLLLGQ